jgi:hypothetical protein
MASSWRRLRTMCTCAKNKVGTGAVRLKAAGSHIDIGEGKAFVVN